MLIRVVTRRLDDGHLVGLRVTTLLTGKGISGRFYLPFRGRRGSATLGPTQLRTRASDEFEVRGHTLSHRALPDLSARGIAPEVHG